MEKAVHWQFTIGPAFMCCVEDLTLAKASRIFSIVFFVIMSFFPKRFPGNDFSSLLFFGGFFSLKLKKKIS